MDAPFAGLLPYIFSRADAFKRQLKDAVSSPMGLLGLRAGQLEDATKNVAGGGLLAPKGSEEYQRWSDAVDQMGPGLLGMTVYHGSPHLFDKFDASKIGTGEGAQAFGHGLYFADNPATAKTYATDRSYVGRAMNGVPDSAEWDAARIAQDAANIHGAGAAQHLQAVLQANKSLKNPAQAAENQKVQDALALLQGGQIKGSGNLYKVDIPDEAIGKMLQWDKPLSQQPEAVRKAPSIAKLIAEDEAYKKRYPSSPIGERLGANVITHVPEKQLLADGIPGIRYLDAGSRATGGTYNTVLFDDALAKILERNGQPVGLLGQ